MKQSVLVGRINVESAVCYIFEQLRYDKSKGIEGGFVPCILAGNDIHTCPILLALPRPNQVNGLCGGIFSRTAPQLIMISRNMLGCLGRSVIFWR